MTSQVDPEMTSKMLRQLLGQLVAFYENCNYQRVLERISVSSCFFHPHFRSVKCQNIADYFRQCQNIYLFCDLSKIGC